MDILKEKLNQGDYEEVINLCKGALNSCPNEAEIWYTMFLAENKNFTEPVKEIFGEMEFNKALSLSDEKQKAKLEAEYVICKTLSQVPYLPSLYLAISNNDAKNILKYLLLVQKINHRYWIIFGSDFTATSMRLLSVKKEDIYDVYFYLCTKYTVDSGFHDAFFRAFDKADLPDDDAVKRITDFYKGQINLESLLNERNSLSEGIAESKKELEEAKKRMEILEDEIQKKEETLRTLDREIDTIKAGQDAHLIRLDSKVGDVVPVGMFKNQPVYWRILEIRHDKALLLSGEIIASMAMDRFSNNYATSSLRKWLNDSFYREAFSNKERGFILKTKTDNSPDSLSTGNLSISNPYACRDTEDFLFLLSAKDILHYFPQWEDRKAHGTDSAGKSGLYVSKNDLDSSKRNTSYWWLRSPAYIGSDCMQDVGANGSFHYNYVNDLTVGVRPAMWIKL